ncbi:MAG: DUF4367 domain-containing protein [Oscillibacter sp.]|nr:DUF4367 domain-containing protein [Oscillibacter sp.]
MNHEDSGQKYEYLNQLSTPELEALLQADMESSGDTDPDMLLSIMEVIVKREHERNPQGKERVEQAWTDFQTIYATPEGEGRSLYSSELLPEPDSLSGEKESTPQIHSKHNHRQLRRTLLIVAVIACLIVFFMPPALGYRNILHMIGVWTSETFTFITGPDAPDESAPVPTSSPGDEAKEYQSLEDALEDYGITANVIIPERFELRNISATDIDDFSTLTIDAFYKDIDQVLLISITQYSIPHTYVYEKTDEKVDEYVKDDITYYIYQNNAKISASWYVDTVEYYVQGDLTMDELLAMIDAF